MGSPASASASASIHTAPKKGCCQCLSSRGAAAVPPPFQETLQDQQVGLAKAPITLLLLPRFVWDFVSPQSGVCFPGPQRLLQLSPAGSSKAKYLGGAHVPGAGPLGLWVLIWGSELLLLWENLCNIIILQLVGCPHPGVMGFDYIVSLLLLLVLFWVN